MPDLSPEDVLAASGFVATQLALAKRRSLAALAQMWRVADPRDVRGSLEPVLPRVVRVMHQQQAAGRVAAWTQAQLAVAVASPNVEPGEAVLPISADRDGLMRSGASFAAVVAPTVPGVLARIGQGMTPEQSLAQGARILAGMVGSIAHDEARATTFDVVSGGAGARKITGYARQSEGAKTCDFCLMLETRGPVYSEESAGFEAHAMCDCTVYAIAMDDFEVSDSSWSAYERWAGREARGGTSASTSSDSSGMSLSEYRAADPGRLAVVEAQIASYEPIVATGGGTEWMRTQLQALYRERDALAA